MNPKQRIAQALTQSSEDDGAFEIAHQRPNIASRAGIAAHFAGRDSDAAFRGAMGHYGYGAAMGGLGLAAGGAAVADPFPATKTVLGLMSAGAMGSAAKHVGQGNDLYGQSMQHHEDMILAAAEEIQARRGYPSNARGADNMSMAALRYGADVK